MRRISRFYFTLLRIYVFTFLRFYCKMYLHQSFRLSKAMPNCTVKALIRQLSIVEVASLT